MRMFLSIAMLILDLTVVSLMMNLVKCDVDW